ncbi:hypothetical protein BCR33DRAFT_18217 [Rhizoclosmatium globosum]|uniref:Receptor ligand binding region domain-containing protein n=1 Tax=Rhizoclosmatium globosum TaxID=329046 RepID=A0A1Y2CQ50_9FUNG|nr:hypothetical protein BCR33DRAFT_18217 [Rhizoclosmatium globosum]|eukprot:ORY49077.1 hypothetical protein BCR33DRAFT_18217 [Rhizoclosmatium globosum]
MATTKTNVTIAFIGPYRWLPGLKYNGTLVTNDIWTAVNMTNYIYDFFQPTAPGVFYWCDIAGDLAIQAINANDSLLPNIHINIKRYNDAGPPYKSPGYTLAHTMPEIIADQDVIAIFADFDRKVTGYSGEVMSIAELPFCGIETFSFKMLNRYKYPYLMQMMTMAGIAQATYLLLQQWNVRRMAIIYSYSNNEWTSQAYSIIDYISRGGVTILTQLNSDLVLTPGGVDYLASMLQLVDARYIMIVSDVYNIADVYYSLANRNASVGPDYVWLGNFPPVVNGDGTKIYGPNFFKLSRGFIFIAGGNMPTQYSSNLMNTFTAKVNNITAPLGANPSPFNIGNINMAIAYDCAGLLASGFQKVLTSNPQFTPQMLASRKLNAYMNSTLFENTGYRGISGDPMIMGPGARIFINTLPEALHFQILYHLQSRILA